MDRDDKKIVFLDLDEDGNVIHLEKEIIEEDIIIDDFDETPKIDEETLKKSQIQDIINDERYSYEDSYYEEYDTEEIGEIIGNILDEVKSIEKSNDLFDSMEKERSKLEKRYIKVEDSIEEIYDFSNEVEDKKESKSFLSKVFDKFKKDKNDSWINLKNKKSKSKPKPVEKEEVNTEINKEEEVKEEEVKEENVEVKEKKKAIVNVKNLLIFIIFTLLFGVIVKYMFVDTDGRLIDTSPNQQIPNEIPRKQETPKKNNTVQQPPSNLDITGLFAYIDRTNEIFEALDVVSIEELETIAKYLENKVKREELLLYLKKSKTQKEQLETLLNQSVVSGVLDGLHGVSQRRFREAINISKQTMQHLNLYNKKSDIQLDVAKYINLDDELITLQVDELEKLLKQYNVSFVREGNAINYSK